MKKMLTAATILAMAAFFCLPGKTLAAGNDTLVVYANGPSLDEVINSDTTSAGAQAHNVYELVSLDTTYLYTGIISPKTNNFSLIGVRGADGRPPDFFGPNPAPARFVSTSIESTGGTTANITGDVATAAGSGIGQSRPTAIRAGVSCASEVGVRARAGASRTSAAARAGRPSQKPIASETSRQAAATRTTHVPRTSAPVPAERSVLST